MNYKAIGLTKQKSASVRKCVFLLAQGSPGSNCSTRRIIRFEICKSMRISDSMEIVESLCRSYGNYGSAHVQIGVWECDLVSWHSSQPLGQSMKGAQTANEFRHKFKNTPNRAPIWAFLCSSKFIDFLERDNRNKMTKCKYVSMLF